MLDQIKVKSKSFRVLPLLGRTQLIEKVVYGNGLLWGPLQVVKVMICLYDVHFVRFRIFFTSSLCFLTHQLLQSTSEIWPEVTLSFLVISTRGTVINTRNS